MGEGWFRSVLGVPLPPPPTPKSPPGPPWGRGKGLGGAPILGSPFGTWWGEGPGGRAGDTAGWGRGSFFPRKAF